MSTWIPIETSLPTEADGDCDRKVWIWCEFFIPDPNSRPDDEDPKFISGGWHAIREPWGHVRTQRPTHWCRTGLTRPGDPALPSDATDQGADKPRCDHCGSDRIYSGPPDCPMCGAPVCCQQCCQITTLAAQVAHQASREKRLREALEIIVKRYDKAKGYDEIYSASTGMVNVARKALEETKT